MLNVDPGLINPVLQSGLNPHSLVANQALSEVPISGRTQTKSDCYYVDNAAQLATTLEGGARASSEPRQVTCKSCGAPNPKVRMNSWIYFNIIPQRTFGFPGKLEAWGPITG